MNNLWLFFSIKTFCFRPVLLPPSLNSFVKTKVAFSFRIKQQYTIGRQDEKGRRREQSAGIQFQLFRYSKVELGGNFDCRVRSERRWRRVLKIATIIQQIDDGEWKWTSYPEPSSKATKAINFHFLKNLFYVLFLINWISAAISARLASAGRGKNQNSSIKSIRILIKFHSQKRQKVDCCPPYPYLAVLSPR